MSVLKIKKKFMDVELKKYFAIPLKEHFTLSNLAAALREIWVNEQ